MSLKFLDAKIIYEDNQIKTKVHRNERKLPVHWTSKIPKPYKRNATNADLLSTSTLNEEKILRRYQQLNKNSRMLIIS